MKMYSCSIAVLGPALTHSDLATRTEIFQSIFANEKISRKYFSGIRQAIEAVKKGKVQYALVPIENSIYGTVRETEDALFWLEPKILSAFTAPIHHALLVKKNTQMRDIKTIISHQQSMEQCENFLRKFFPKIKKISVGSTTQAIEMVAEGKEKNAAAIGPVEAGTAYGLEVLREKIENTKNNKTLFLLLAKNAEKNASQNRKGQRAHGASAQQAKRVALPPLSEASLGNNMRTSIVFWFGKDQPGTLYEVLREFAKEKINLSKIESRPVSRKLGEYIFFLDFDGSENGKKGKKVLKKIQKFVAGIKSFGSYEVIASS